MIYFPESEARRRPERARDDLVHLRDPGHLRRRLRAGVRPQVILLGEEAVAALWVQLDGCERSETAEKGEQKRKQNHSETKFEEKYDLLGRRRRKHKDEAIAV